MVALPRVGAYSESEVAEVRAASPAFARYEELLRNSALDPLHRERHEAWRECVLAEYFKRATTADICAHWSATADRVVRRAWSDAGLDSLACALFALGKQGAEELNLSSDIDVLLVAEASAASEIEKKLRVFQSRLQKNSDSGFCYRLDFDLRPGGTMGPIVTTLSQFQDYYWSQGETWERLAMVRLRPMAGPAAIVDQVMDLARRFSFRKFLDFTLLEDLKALRSQVHQKGFARVQDEIHLKLEVGGIRDVELFTHSLLILNGGKLAELRTRSTTEALKLLPAKNLLKADEAEFLLESYWYFRHLENLVQAVDDRQTHSFKVRRPPPGSAPNEAQVLRERMDRVNQIVSTLLGQIDLETVRLPNSPETQDEWLKGLGFSDEVRRESWPQLIQATALSHKNDRDERARREFLYSFVEQLAQQPGEDRDLGFRILVDFVRSTRAKATFFTTLLRSPRLMQDLARLFCLSPYLGMILAARPELLDNFILQVDEKWSSEFETLIIQMSERKLLTEIWAANHFLNDPSLPTLFDRITTMADQISLQLLKHLKSEFPKSQVRLLALGKWGGRELGLRSDLDFVFVTPAPPTEDDFKVARRFISRLTDPLKGGSLYDIDLRLRPSGQSGAILVSRDSLLDYWLNRAEPWERQAYTRTRALEPDVSLDKSLLFKKSLSVEDLGELKRIRSLLLKATSETKIDLKYAPGGLIDIEFVAQTALLKLQITPSANAATAFESSTVGMIQNLMAADPSWKTLGASVIRAYETLRRFEQSLQLASAHKTTALEKSNAAFKKFSSLIKLDADSSWELVEKTLRESRQILNDLDPTGLKI